jgi:iron complex transport system permease protein
MSRRWGHVSRPARFVLLGLGLLVVVASSFQFGKYAISPVTVSKVLLAKVFPIHHDWSQTTSIVVLEIRLPRVLAALLVGGALASAGVAYQTMFRNPLVSPDILGVSAGAACGASLAISFGLPQWGVDAVAFCGGLLATGIVYGVARTFAGRTPITLVLTGVVIAAFFSAVVSIVLFFANPLNTLPEITFWLLGGLANATNTQDVIAALVVLPAGLVLYLFRWPIHVLALGGDDAHALGVRQERLWLIVVACTSLITSAVVAISGIIGWVGLLVPHMARMFFGSRFADVLPAATLLGAGFLLIVDSVARNVLTGSLPLGPLTAIIGAPFFLVLLLRTYGALG